ncbi:ABC transporter ATP-binding protein [Erysipelotrichaceae bacterium HCN-30851]
MNKIGNIRLMARMSLLVKPLAPYMLLAVFFGVTGFLCAIYIPYFSALLISHIAIQAPDFPVKVFFILMIVFAVLRGILHYAEQACNHYIAFRLLAILRDKVFTVLRKLAPAKLEGRDKGNLIYLITSDIEALEVFYAHTISPILIAIITCIILLTEFYKMHVMFFVIALCGYLFCGLILPWIITKLGKQQGKQSREGFGELSSYTLETLRGLQDILQYRIGEERLHMMSKKSEELHDVQKRLKLHEGNTIMVSNIIVTSFTFLMLVCGSYLYMQGAISFTSVIMSTVLMVSSFGPVLALANLSNNLLITMASARRVLGLLDEEEIVKEITGKEHSTAGDIEIKDLTFAYDDEEILKDINAHFKKGNIIGIHGKSGSGKSTLLKLIMRFWNAPSNSILINDRSVDDINTKDLRDMQSFVTQETVLFHDSIFNNIIIAKLDASVDEVENACKKAGIHDFIMSLPQGYATKVAELGDSLSGGEKQRIAIARAFLHDSPCILLDEPTSNLDALNEAIILKSLREQKDKTILLVSHRPGTMRIADSVLTIDSGRVS